ncbi:cytochrome o ubiquinol oxidase subunit IV [Candidatus Pantoea persica]|uniref:cytochrome o ubiquinol oxidase subunit IV n=1 Tax=Candidatus Pantoea persica TaxID=2518128 RepID=UPI00215DBD70|nr:cytochrome o ubiquinol oxidase subunit IV [Candidatus Pantoea persica]MBA2815394.1 Ubiquinol oxidase subunit 4 [Candidatus Pantoea persica]
MSHSANRNVVPHSSVKSYMIGFIFSVILTGIPFWIVMSGVSSQGMTLGVVVACAVSQVVVHLIYFLHLDTKSEGGWNIIAIVFSALIILIVVVGSLWIMWNLNYNMMVR